MDRETFGYLLEEQLKALPPAATTLLDNVAIVVEDRPPGPPEREADFLDQPLSDLRHLARYWAVIPAHEERLPLTTIRLYMEPILATGGEPGDEIRRVLLETIERRHRLDRGSLAVEPDDDDGDVLPVEDAPESLVEIAESEIEALPGDARDWFDTVEIASVESPEAAGDPERLADYPSHDDEMPALVLYARNIRRRPEPAPTLVREILREALARRRRA